MGLSATDFASHAKRSVIASETATGAPSPFVLRMYLKTMDRVKRREGLK
jgi:hypothetical protein